MREFKAWTRAALSAGPGPGLANNGGHDTINTVVVTIIVAGEFHALPPGPKDWAAGWKAPADPPIRRSAAGPAPSQAPLRRRRFEVPIRQIESINYEGNNLAAPRGAAAERSRGIRPQIALSLPK